MRAVWADANLSEITVQDRSARDDRFELRVLYASGRFAVRQVLLSVMDGLSGLGLSDSEKANIELVLAEALNNVAEHAYHGVTAGLVELRVRRFPNHLSFVIMDEGHPMPTGEIPRHDATDTWTRGDLPEGGFGWLLLRTLARNFAYKRVDGRNTLAFEIHFDRRLRDS